MADKYTIRTVEDFAAVPEEKLVECLRNFILFLSLVRDQEKLNSDILLAFELPDGVMKFNPGVFVWIDDGLDGFSEINMVDEETNETVFSFGLVS